MALIQAETTAVTLGQLQDRARQIIAAGVPENTRRTYRAQWTNFLAWCARHNRQSLPASGDTLVLYLTSRSDEVKVSSLNVALAAITVAHRESGMHDWSASDLPGVRVFMRGLRREKAEVTQKKEALRLSDLARGLPPNSSKERDLRDRALLLLGFFSALRRSELVGLDVHDIRTIPTGLRLTIRRSKTDKNTEGQTVIVPLLTEHITLCPVTAVNMWLQHRGQEPGPLFWSLRSKLRLSPQEIARIVKKAARQAGYDPRDFGAHSLRAGFATSAAEVEAEERDIMRVTRHRSERTVREYIREGQAGSSHPGFKIAAAVAEGKT